MSDDKQAVAEEVRDRLEQARQQKNQIQVDLREGYFFCAPHRSRTVSSTSDGSSTKPQDAEELNISFGMEIAGDFSTVILDTFVPQAEKWAKRTAGPDVPKEVADAAQGDIDKGDAIVFDAVTASNFYAECGKTFTPDLGLGTVAMWVEDKRPSEPIMCQGVPLRELEINLGPHGEIDDRFIVRHTRYRHLKALLRGVDLPSDVAQLVDQKPKDKVIVTWAFWRRWERDDDVVWRHVLMVGKTVVDDRDLVGRGSCPLIVARFGAGPEWAWGTGPLVQVLPDLRVLDYLADAKVRNLDFTLQPPTGYPDDSFSHVEEGIESGMAYPIRPGSESAIKPIYQPNPPDAAIYDRQDLEQRIKRVCYLDWPTQRGDTPPTATQWLDEMMMAQRRIGTPGMTFWAEFPAEVFLRFAHIMTKRGRLPEVKVEGKTVALTPYNPAQRAAEQQEVAMATRAVQIGGQAFPEEWKAKVDGSKTIENFVKKLGAEKIIMFRPKEQIDAAVSMISQLSGGQAPGAPAVAGPSAAPPADLAGAAPPLPETQIKARA